MDAVLPFISHSTHAVHHFFVIACSVDSVVMHLMNVLHMPITNMHVHCVRFWWLLLAYRELCDEPTAPCGAVNLSHLLNPWPQLAGHNGGVLAVDVVVDGIVDVDVLALRVGGV